MNVQLERIAKSADATAEECMKHFNQLEGVDQTAASFIADAFYFFARNIRKTNGGDTE